MGKDLWEQSSRVKELFELASDLSGIDLKKLLFEGNEEELKATDKTQVAITLFNAAANLVLKENGISPDGAAGFSLGEYTALYEAGIIALEDLFPIVKLRGDIMEEVSRSLDSPDGNPGMAAVIGIGFDGAKEVLGRLDGVYLANFNSPSQVVIAGTFAGLSRAETAFKDAGARRVIPLKVSGPFHSPLLEAAGQKLGRALADYSFKDPVLPVFSNVTGERIISGSQARELCTKQVVSTVLWVKEEQSLLDAGYTRFIEAGPGKVLSGLWKAFNKEYTCETAGTLETILKITQE
jgi:[acyl-carrier-protein] S-malonyltransferase